MINPNLKRFSWNFLFNGFPLINSIVYKTKCPPSNIGIGNKLIKPILIDNKIIKLKNEMIPSSNILPEKCAILIGPPKSSKEPFPKNIWFKAFKVKE